MSTSEAASRYRQEQQLQAVTQAAVVQTDIDYKLIQSFYGQEPLVYHEKQVNDKMVEQETDDKYYISRLYPLEEFKKGKIWSSLNDRQKQQFQSPYVEEHDLFGESQNYNSVSRPLFDLVGYRVYPDLALKAATATSGLTNSLQLIWSQLRQLYNSLSDYKQILRYQYVT